MNLVSDADPKRCKPCAACGALLPPAAFEYHPRAPDGRWPYCDVCRAADPSLDLAECPKCHKERRLSAFPNLDADSPCGYCTPTYCGPAIAALEGATLSPVGSTTVADLLVSLGIERPTKADRNAASRWLLNRGYTRRAGSFRVTATAPCDFAAWAASRHGALAALGLPDDTAAAYLNGAPVPRHVRLAMSAVTAGLPPF